MILDTNAVWVSYNIVRVTIFHPGTVIYFTPKGELIGVYSRYSFKKISRSKSWVESVIASAMEFPTLPKELTLSGNKKTSGPFVWIPSYQKYSV